MGSRKAAAVESLFTRQRLDDPELQSALQVFCQLVDAARGPHGHIQSIHNNVGGPFTMTSSSTRIFSAMSFSRPCHRLIVSAIQGHLKNYRDGGLLVGSLCMHLVQNAVKLENVGRNSAREMYDTFFMLIDEYLNSEGCPVSVNVDLSNVKVMLAYIRSIISVKRLCDLKSSSLNHFAQLVLKAFLNSVPDSPKSFLSDKVFTLLFDKSDPMSSEIVEGLLLEWPEKCAMLGKQNLQVVKESAVKVAVVNVSMSGDTDESLTSEIEEAQQEVIQSATDLMMSKLFTFCDWLFNKQVGLLLCQKVIHPKIKSYLRQKGILFVERIGAQPMGYIHDLTGASFISSVMVMPLERFLGQLDSVQHVVLHNKSYLQLQKADSYICTMLLCASVDEQLSELKCVIQSALTGLFSVLQKPVLLCGGGCWQIHIANLVRHSAATRFDEFCSKLHATKAHLQAAANAFASSLEATAYHLCDTSFQPWIDDQNWHLWNAPQGMDLSAQNTFVCACGMLADVDIDEDSLHILQRSSGDHHHPRVNTESRKLDGFCQKRLMVRDSVINYDWLVLDTMDSVVSAIRTAVMTATTILSISQYIYDTN